MRFVSVWSWVRSPQGAFAKGANHKGCRDPGSNQEPSDLRSDALPTELSRLCLQIPNSSHTKTFEMHSAQILRLSFPSSGTLFLLEAFTCIRPRGPMDKASAYGAGDCRFECCRGHFRCNVLGASVHFCSMKAVFTISIRAQFQSLLSISRLFCFPQFLLSTVASRLS